MFEACENIVKNFSKTKIWYIHIYTDIYLNKSVKLKTNFNRPGIPELKATSLRNEGEKLVSKNLIFVIFYTKNAVSSDYLFTYTVLLPSVDLVSN